MIEFNILYLRGDSMSDDSIIKSSLTRKEAKLIRFIRLQQEIDRKTVEEQISALLEKQEENNSEFISDDSAEESENAYWLNSDYYKK